MRLIILKQIIARECMALKKTDPGTEIFFSLRAVRKSGKSIYMDDLLLSAVRPHTCTFA